MGGIPPELRLVLRQTLNLKRRIVHRESSMQHFLASTPVVSTLKSEHLVRRPRADRHAHLARENTRPEPALSTAKGWPCYAARALERFLRRPAGASLPYAAVLSSILPSGALSSNG